MVGQGACIIYLKVTDIVSDAKELNLMQKILVLWSWTNAFCRIRMSSFLQIA